MTFKNSGQTPASNFVSWAEIAVLEPTNERMLVVPKLAGKFARHVAANTQSHKTLIFNSILTPQEIDDLAFGRKLIFLHGRVEYDDIFGRHHFSNFRLKWAGQYPPDPAVMLNFCEQGNNAD